MKNKQKCAVYDIMKCLTIAENPKAQVETVAIQ